MSNFLRRLCFVIGLINIVSFSSIVLVRSCYAGEGFEEIWQQLDQVAAYYDSGRYEKAGKLLTQLKEKVMENSPMGCDGPDSLCRTIVLYDKLLLDKFGYYDDFATFTGTIVYIVGNIGGLITVEGAKEKRIFFYDYNVGMVTINEDHGSGWKGRRVTIYFDEDRTEKGEMPMAVKMVFLD